MYCKYTFSSPPPQRTLSSAEFNILTNLLYIKTNHDSIRCVYIAPKPHLAPTATTVQLVSYMRKYELLFL